MNKTRAFLLLTGWLLIVCTATFAVASNDPQLSVEARVQAQKGGIACLFCLLGGVVGVSCGIAIERGKSF